MEKLLDRYSDFANSDRFIDTWKGTVRYVPKWKEWMIWDGKRWAMDEGGGGTFAMWKTLGEELYENAKMSRSKDTSVNRCVSQAGSFAALAVAQRDERIRTTHDEWDTNHWLFNVENALIDLRAESFSVNAHNSDYLITRCAPVQYDPQATCPRFEQFLGEVFEDHAELIEFVQRMFGLCLTGITRDHAVFILYGTGANGKSTLLNVLSDLLGEYQSPAPPAAFFDDRSDNNANDALAKIRGARAVVCTEPSRNRPLNEAVIKKISGSDMVSARFLHGHFFDYMPTYKALLAVNHKPSVSGQEVGIWRRVKMIPFNVNFVGREDQQLREKLQAELSGILNWAIKGCLAWQKDGLTSPNIVVETTAEYRDEMDDLGPWFEESVIIDPTARATSSELYRSYKESLSKNDRPISQKTFGQMLAERGYGASRDGRTRYRLGLRLRDDNELDLGGTPSWQTDLPDEQN